jgi:hypothetical protein
MKYKIITSDINGVEYISGCVLMSESDQTEVDPSYLVDTPVMVADENGLLQYAIINDNIVHKPQEYSIEQLNKKEIATLKKYLSDTDYIYTKCLELGLDVDIEYADVVSQRKSARTRIQELEVC